MFLMLHSHCCGSYKRRCVLKLCTLAFGTGSKLTESYSDSQVMLHQLIQSGAVKDVVLPYVVSCCVKALSTKATLSMHHFVILCEALLDAGTLGCVACSLWTKAATIRSVLYLKGWRPSCQCMGPAIACRRSGHFSARAHANAASVALAGECLLQL